MGRLHIHDRALPAHGPKASQIAGALVSTERRSSQRSREQTVSSRQLEPLPPDPAGGMDAWF